MKCITGRSWDLIIPSELLQEILSRLGLKYNIRASAVCKTWLEVAVSVRKLQPRPWLSYSRKGSGKGSQIGDYVLSDPSSSQTYKFNSPVLSKFHRFSYSRDGWLLVLKEISNELFLLNPFNREHICLPELPLNSRGRCLAFSAAPTSSTSCLVFSLNYIVIRSDIAINTWRPGETVWTTHLFENQSLPRKYDSWIRCVFSNGMFYCLSTRGHLGVFDPPRATWNILPVKPCPAFGQVNHERRVLVTEHEGDIFVMLISASKNPLLFKLNLSRNVWEETRDLGGLTVFASHHVSLTRAGLPSEMRNRIYTSQIDYCWRHYIYYYSLGDEKRSRPPSTPALPCRIVWVDSPHNINL